MQLFPPFRKKLDGIEGLQAWLQAQCNGDWEPTYGMSIVTPDNPGWRVTVDFEAAEWEDLVIPLMQEQRSEVDWIEIEVRDRKFFGHGGVGNLDEIVHRFLAIVAQRP